MQKTAAKKKRMIVVFLLALMMLCVSGCHQKDIGKIKARMLVMRNLKSHYGGNFKVMSIEKESIESIIFPEYRYKLEVYSEEVDETISVRLKLDGSCMSDNFEEFRYRDEVEKEVGAFELDEDGWNITEQYIDHYGSYPKFDDEDYSTDYESYKRADHKLDVDIDVNITGTDYDAIAESIYAYLAQFHDSDLKFIIDFRSGGEKKGRLKEMKDGDLVTALDIKQVLESQE